MGGNSQEGSWASMFRICAIQKLSIRKEDAGMMNTKTMLYRVIGLCTAWSRRCLDRWD